MRRAVLAVLGAAAGTTVLVGLKAGLLAAPTGTAAATAGLAGVAEQPTMGSTGPAAPTKLAATGGAKPTAPASRAAATAAGTGMRDGRFTGSLVQTKYGPVQVAITVSGGRMTDVTAVQLPSGDATSLKKSQQAAPILRQEALTAQSAKIDTVSGATYTSDAYKTSLQAALDAARRA